MDPDAGLVALLALDGLPDDETHRARIDGLLGGLYEDLGLAPSVVE